MKVTCAEPEVVIDEADELHAAPESVMLAEPPTCMLAPLESMTLDCVSTVVIDEPPNTNAPPDEATRPDDDETPSVDEPESVNDDEAPLALKVEPPVSETGDGEPLMTIEVLLPSACMVAEFESVMAPVLLMLKLAPEPVTETIDESTVRCAAFCNCVEPACTLTVEPASTDRPADTESVELPSEFHVLVPVSVRAAMSVSVTTEPTPVRSNELPEIVLLAAFARPSDVTPPPDASVRFEYESTNNDDELENASDDVPPSGDTYTDELESTCSDALPSSVALVCCKVAIDEPESESDDVSCKAKLESVACAVAPEASESDDVR